MAKKTKTNDHYFIARIDLDNGKSRYVIADADTGEVAENAQGNGFKSEEKAMNSTFWNRKATVDNNKAKEVNPDNIEIKMIKDEDWIPRYILVDKSTGEVLDDAQGYGYKSEQTAKNTALWKRKTSGMVNKSGKVPKEEYKNIVPKQISEKGEEERYILVNKETGEIVEDANGYGFKSVQKAYACFYYKNRTPEEAKTYKEKQKLIEKFMEKHKGLTISYVDDVYHALKGDDDYGLEDFRGLLKCEGIDLTNEGFTDKDLYRYIRK